MRTASVGRSFINGASKMLLCCMMLVASRGVGSAQSITINDGVTPASAAPGSPLGSYSISNFEDINLFNGVVNFKIPLASLDGRGNTGTRAFYRLQHNLWSVYQEPFLAGVVYERPQLDGVGNGVSFSGFGSIEFRRNVYPQVSNNMPCIDGDPEQTVLSFFVFREPDGTEHALFDQATGGGALTAACNSTSIILNRGRIFVSADRSMTYVTDHDIVDGDGSIPQTTGTLHFNDGAIARFENGIGQGSVWVRDKNGNIMTLAWTDIANVINRQIVVTDSLNRTITVSSSNGIGTVAFKGYGGAQRTIKLHASTLDQVLVPGDTIKTDRELFPDLTYHPAWGNIPNNRSVLSAIEYPNGQSIRFLYNSYGEVARILLPTGGGYDYHYEPTTRYGLILQRRLQARITYKSLTATAPYYNPPSDLIESKTYFTASRRYDLVPRRTIVTIQNKDSNDVLLSQETHEYYGEPSGYQEGCHGGVPVWYDGREYKSEKWLCCTNIDRSL